LEQRKAKLLLLANQCARGEGEKKTAETLSTQQRFFFVGSQKGLIKLQTAKEKTA